MTNSEPIDKERGARLAEKYRAIRAQQDQNGDPNEVIDRFAERVFGTDEGFEVLIDYLREKQDPAIVAESETERRSRVPRGR